MNPNDLFANPTKKARKKAKKRYYFCSYTFHHSNSANGTNVGHGMVVYNSTSKATPIDVIEHVLSISPKYTLVVPMLFKEVTKHDAVKWEATVSPNMMKRQIVP